MEDVRRETHLSPGRPPPWLPVLAAGGPGLLGEAMRRRKLATLDVEWRGQWVPWHSRTAAERREERQRRKEEHQRELERRGEGEPGMDPLSPELTEAWGARYLDAERVDGPPHRTVQRLTLGIPVVLRLDAARLP